MTQISLNNLQLNKAGRKRGRRIGRGNSSGRGTYSGRGFKGQKARAGGKGGLKRRGLKQLLRSKPKIGGFKSLRPKMVSINLDQLEKNFESGEIVNPKKILSIFTVDPNKFGIKILGDGKLTKKLKVSADAFSESAKQAIITAGGSVEVIVKQKKSKVKRPRKKIV